MRKLFIYLSIIPALVLGQDSLNVTKIGGFPYWDGPYAVEVVDTLAYVAAGLGGLRIVNISDLTNLVEIGYYDTPDLAEDVEVRGHYAFVADDGSGLRVIDVSVPTLPVEVESFQSEGSISHIELVGDTAYLTGVYTGFLALDISDPTNIIEIARYEEYYLHDFAISGNFAYVIENYTDTDGSDRVNKLLIYDISNLSDIDYRASYDPQPGCHHVSIVNQLMYLSIEHGGVEIHDISTPDSLVLLSVYDAPSSAYRCEVFGGIAYVSTWVGGLRILDVSDSTEPIEVGNFPVDYSPSDVVVFGDHLLLADDRDGLRSIDVSNPSLPIEVGFFRSTESYNPYRCIVFRDNYAFVAEVVGLRVYDVSDPRNPIKVSDSDTLKATEFVIQGDYAYVVGGFGGIRIVDVSNPASLTDVGFYEHPGYAGDIEIWNNHLLVDPLAIDPDTSALQILDISNPVSPSLVGIIGLWGIADIEVVDNLVYLLGYDGLRVFDISTPSAPVEIGLLDPWSGGYDIVVRGNYAYVADCNPGLRILDISDPTSPFEIAVFETDHCAYQLDYWDGHIYVADSRGGTRVVDVSNPYAPSGVGYYEPRIDYSFSHSGTHFVTYKNGYIYAAETHGFNIYDISAALTTPEHHPNLPTQFSLHPIYPNPFNNTANISFDLPREVTGRLVVYDVLGRLTNTLYNGKLAAGSHSMQFNGNGLSSGTYFVRLETPAFTATRKASLLK